ncbi:MAG: translocation/assembly module TamB domain-containing protein [Myxococcales bacterium]|nr:translocation/assembly module TamB domain-containing protein [Myxococcales bacterium]
MRIRRWIKRGVLGLLGLVVVAVAAVLILIHTSFGRELVRRQIEAKLADLFIGGGHVGAVEGSPFGTLVLRDVVLDGSDGEPVLSVKKVSFELGLLSLISKHANLSAVVVEDVELRIARDQDGGLQVLHMMRPQPSTGWSVDVADLLVHRAHVAYDTGTEWMNLDALEIVGAAHLPYQRVVETNLSIRGAWRERVAGVSLDAVVRIDGSVITIPSLIAQAGALTVAGANLTIVASPDALPVMSGTVIVNAPAIAVAQLVPGVQLPADLAFAANLTSTAPWTHVSLLGQIGGTPVRAMLDADLTRRFVRGVIASGTLPLAALSRGKLVGSGGGVVMFEATPGEPGMLPTARGVLAVWGELAGLPAGHAAIAFDTHGERARTAVGIVAPSVRAMLEGELLWAGEALRLPRGTLIASTSDPATASGGKADVHGALSANLAVSGTLWPEPNLAVVGHASGRRLRFQDLSVASMSLAIDARELPRQPRGRARLELVDLVRGDLQLGQLRVTAANRADGKLVVSARSRPKLSPWVIDVDALVTPPGKGATVTVDVVRHVVRAGDGGTWTGTTGHLVIDPRRIVLRDLNSTSTRGMFAVAGELDRRSGDFHGNMLATGLALDTLDPRLQGILDAHVDVSRTRGTLAGTIEVTGKRLALAGWRDSLELVASVQAGSDKLAIQATASSPNLGSATFALDLDAPKDLTNVAMWKHLHREVIRTGQISLHGVNLSRVAELAGHSGEVTAGRLDGDVHLAAATIGGTLQLRDVMGPALRGTTGLTADLQITQSARDELTPTLSGKLDPLGAFQISARVGFPEHLFDLDAWKALGPHILRGARLHVDDVTIDPAQLDRFGITAEVRAHVSLTADVTEALSSAHVAIDVKQLRGNPVTKPLDAYLVLAIDSRGANSTLVVRSASVTILDVKGTVPLTIGQLRANPRALLMAPLALTATIPSLSAPVLLGVFGRTEVVGGTLEGTLQVAGTVAQPVVTMKLLGTKLAVPPGPRNRPIKMIETITVVGAWDGTIARVAIDGVQRAGSLKLNAQLDPRRLREGTATIKATAFDLAPLFAFAPGPAGGAGGRLDADLKIQGLDPETMQVAGELHLTGARIPIAPQIGTLRRAKVDVVINATALKIDVTGRLGGGDVKLASEFVLDGSLPTSGTATLALRKVSPIGSVEPVVDADLTAKLSRSGDQWTADVLVKNGHVVVPSGRGEPLDPAGAPPDMVFATGERMTDRPMKKGPPRHASLIANVTISATTIKSDELRGIIRGKLTVSADAESIGIVGTVQADRADLDLFGRRYQVEQAAVHFDGTTDPLLDLRIAHDFADVATITTVRGRLSKPDLILSSDPGIYSQGQLLGFLLGGEPSGDPSSGSARDQATVVGASFVANKLGGYVKSALPVDLDVLRYEAATAGTSAAVTVGSWLTRSLFVAYRQHLEARVDENSSEGQLEYWLSRRISIEATAGDRGYNGIDLLWRKRY